MAESIAERYLDFNRAPDVVATLASVVLLECLLSRPVEVESCAIRNHNYHQERVRCLIPDTFLLSCNAMKGCQLLCKFFGVQVPSEVLPQASAKREVLKRKSVCQDSLISV